jgi:hypothetical protein
VRTVTKNTFWEDRTSGGTDGGGGPVASFRFDQFSDNSIKLQIQNIRSDEEETSFTFKVEFNPIQVSVDTPPWENEGAVTKLAHGQFVDQGVIANNPSPIDVGTFNITLRNIDPRRP